MLNYIKFNILKVKVIPDQRSNCVIITHTYTIYSRGLVYLNIPNADRLQLQYDHNGENEGRKQCKQAQYDIKIFVSYYSTVSQAHA